MLSCTSSYDGTEFNDRCYSIEGYRETDDNCCGSKYYNPIYGTKIPSRHERVNLKVGTVARIFAQFCINIFIKRYHADDLLTGIELTLWILIAGWRVTSIRENKTSLLVQTLNKNPIISSNLVTFYFWFSKSFDLASEPTEKLCSLLSM